MSSARSSQPGGGWTPWGIAGLAFAIRLLPAHAVFRHGQIYFTDSDCDYHLRRIAYSLASFPQTLGHDAYLNFPDGAKAIWPATLDWLLALLVWPVASAEVPESYERILVFVPPLIGALAVLVVHHIGLRNLDRRVANTAACVLALLPAHFWYSQIGFLDHHAVVSLCAAGLLAATLGLAAHCGRVVDGGWPAWGAASAFGFGLAFSVMIWPGALLHVVLALGCLLALALGSARAATRIATLRLLGIASAVACVVVAPMSIGNEWPQWSPYSAVVLSRFQPWLFGVAALYSFGLAGWCARAVDPGFGKRLAVGFGLGSLLVLASFALLPGLLDSMTDSLQWLGRTDDFQALVGESVPLFVLHGRFTSQIASARLTWFIFLFPFAVVWLAWRWRGDPHASERYLLLGWAVVLFVFTLLQKRFFNSFAIPFSLVMALALCDVAQRAMRPPRFGVKAQNVAIAALAFALFLPSLPIYLDALSSDLAALQGNARPNLRTESNRVRRRLTQWLGAHTPPTAGFFDATARPEYGVLARWGEGHFITYRARRPAVIGNFGDDLGGQHFLRARRFFEAPPDEAATILEALRVRYVVIRARNESRPMARRLFEGDGSRLARFRLVHEVEPMAGSERASYKVFEFVPGAVVSGRTVPRALVRAQLEAITNLGRPLQFEAVAQADTGGRYVLRLPIPNVRVPDGLAPADRYTIESAGEVARLAIGEAAVRDGSEIAGPSFSAR